MTMMRFLEFKWPMTSASGFASVILQKMTTLKNNHIIVWMLLMSLRFELFVIPQKLSV